MQYDNITTSQLIAMLQDVQAQLLNDNLTARQVAELQDAEVQYYCEIMLRTDNIAGQ